MHTVPDPQSLQPEQRAAVEAAAQNRGVLEILVKSDTRGPAVRAGKVKLYDPDDSGYARRCCEAVADLVHWQLLRQAGGPKRYELTNYGWQLSRALTAHPQQDPSEVANMDTVARSELQSEREDQQQGDESLAAVPTMALAASKEETSGESVAGMSTMAFGASNEEATETFGEASESGDESLASVPTMAFAAAQEEPDDTGYADTPHESSSLEGTPSSKDDSGDDQAESDSEGEDQPPSEPRSLPQSMLLGGETETTKTSLIAELGLDDGFQPEEPRSLEETGLNGALIEDLILKVVQNAGSMSGRQIAEHLCLPLAILEDRYNELRKRQHLTPTGSAMLGDHVYQLTDHGRERARIALKECAYAGPAPVPLEDYVDSVQAQTIRTEKPKRAQLEKAFSDINVEPEMLARLGPAISAGKGMFIYGPPGNGKTTVAQRITRCFGQNILIPHAIVEDGQIIKFYDASCHETVESKVSSMLLNAEHDRRWIRIRRPTVVVGGELTMDSLELKHDPVSHISEASLQLKSNCGSLLIDDFGRQRVNPTELLNRWIVPLENRIDYLTLANGKKVEVPFEQLIIFSTNLEPHDLADDAFLRRIPFKIEVGAPSRDEFAKLFDMFAEKLKVVCPPESLNYLLANHYDSCGRPLRRCQARDLLDQVAHYCEYNELPPVATNDVLDHAVNNYFTAMAGVE